MSKQVNRHLSATELDVREKSAGGDLKAAREFIARELVEGVRHGFSKMTIVVEKVQSSKTSITVEAGKSYRFVV